MQLSYRYKDLKRVGTAAHRAELIDSPQPFDWILRVLCFEEVHHNVWQEVAAKINSALKTRRTEARFAVAYFVIALVLRGPSKTKELIEMLQIKLDEIPIIRDVIDRAEDYAVRKALVRRIFMRLQKRVTTLGICLPPTWSAYPKTTLRRLPKPGRRRWLVI
ncbi:hypothetical protein HJB89_11070 [Rhizobium sp. NZLR8]|uniref:hypothetical protein n=1 Tax=Rhizobium sp. NZLR8 TaxID=2731104 RepID=UPI001C83576E|nr:hypothetical protein [Rhizobium sp. NZLR8]MBX5157664.1 hypothetical protein [Rhizobium sp. NZLR8]